MNALSITQDETLEYPREPGYSPSTRYPEYRYGSIAREPNRVYEAVRATLAQARLDERHCGTAAWNPLGAFIRPGQRVFVLCNFVYHRTPPESPARFAAKCIHGSVLRALIDYLLIAVGRSGEVRFGNAPLQSARWPALMRDTGAGPVEQFYRSIGEPVRAADLRLYRVERTALGSVTAVERRDEGDGVAIDLGAASLLDPLQPEGRCPFRVTQYDPRRTAAFHARGSHVYVVNREVLAADVIVSLPKLKTHEKVGITGALKGCVGAIGNKECLAHHRFGPPELGGDEYPSDRFRVKRVISQLHDQIQQTAVDHGPGRKLRALDRVLHSLLLRLMPPIAGAWWGNDTAWRMSLDIARIVRYAGADGVLRTEPVRPHLVLVDGIIGGQGAGPLKPRPVRSGLVLFADDPVLADTACAAFMGFNPERIPLISHSLALEQYPLTERSLADMRVTVNGRPQSIAALQPRAGYEPPPGWRGRIEQRLTPGPPPALLAARGVES